MWIKQLQFTRSTVWGTVSLRTDLCLWSDSLKEPSLKMSCGYRWISAATRRPASVDTLLSTVVIAAWVTWPVRSFDCVGDAEGRTCRLADITAVKPRPVTSGPPTTHWETTVPVGSVQAPALTNADRSTTDVHWAALTHKIHVYTPDLSELEQEAPLPRRAQRVRRA